MLVILFLILLAYLFYKWSTATYDFFEKQGIPFRKPIALFGTNLNAITNKKVMTEELQDIYYEFENEKFSGLFEFRRPVVLLRDPQLIKQLTVRDFDHFMNHRVLMTEELDPLFGKNLVSLTGQKWRDMRSTLSPAFTGSKMRQMFELVKAVALQTTETLTQDIKEGKENVLEFQDFASTLTCDNIATCAFGLEVNSFKNPTNEFRRLANKVTDFSNPATGFKFLGYLLCPRIMKALKIQMLDKEGSDFFQGVFFDTIRTREEQGIVRNDMINLLLEAKKGKLVHNEKAEDNITESFANVEESNVGKSAINRKLTDHDIAAQCFAFFQAGFHPVAQAISFAAYELACNPDIQERLYQEIKTNTKDDSGEKMTHEKLQSLKYLDQVISETLRKWPPALAAERLCSKDYELKMDNKTLRLKAGYNTLAIPIFSIHRDPKYYSNPEKFDPERFSEENRHKILDTTYLPFGIGPRSCIGSRFALMEIKTIIFYLLLNFSIEVTEKTQIPLKFKNVTIHIKPVNGIWLGLKPRDD